MGILPIVGTEGSRWDVRVLGAPTFGSAASHQPFPAGRPGRLLASLLVARGHAVSDDRLVGR